MMICGRDPKASGVKLLKHENALARERQEQFYTGLEADLLGKHAETVS